jgi:hypothetical protein
MPDVNRRPLGTPPLPDVSTPWRADRRPDPAPINSRASQIASFSRLGTNGFTPEAASNIFRPRHRAAHNRICSGSGEIEALARGQRCSRWLSRSCCLSAMFTWKIFRPAHQLLSWPCRDSPAVLQTDLPATSTTALAMISAPFALRSASHQIQFCQRLRRRSRQLSITKIGLPATTHFNLHSDCVSFSRPARLHFPSDHD